MCRIRRIWYERGYSRQATIALVVFALLSVGAHGQAEAPVLLSVKSEATVNDEVVRLGDIAVRVDSDGPRKEGLLQMVVSKAPQPADSRRITMDYIRLRLKQNRVDPAAVQLRGAKAVVVKRSHVDIGAQRLHEIVTQFLKRRSFGQDTTLRITKIRTPEHLILPQGEVTYKVLPPRHVNKSSRMRLTIHFYVDRQFVRKMNATAQIELLKKVVVARRIIGRYKPITREDIALKEVDIAGAGRDVLTDVEDILGRRCRRTVYPGSVIDAGQIEYPPVVKRGDLVMIVAQSKGFRISALGEAKKNGKPGDRIKVVNLDSRKVVYARVVDSETVQVDF